MNPPQLRETTMDPNTRRLVQLTLDDFEGTREVMDMLLAKKRAGDRKSWLESKGNRRRCWFDPPWAGAAESGIGTALGQRAGARAEAVERASRAGHERRQSVRNGLVRRCVVGGIRPRRRRAVPARYQRLALAGRTGALRSRPAAR